MKTGYLHYNIIAIYQLMDSYATIKHNYLIFYSSIFPE